MFEFQDVASPAWPCPSCYILDVSLHIWGRRWCNFSSIFSGVAIDRSKKYITPASTPSVKGCMKDVAEGAWPHRRGHVLEFEHATPWLLRSGIEPCYSMQAWEA